MMNFSFLKPGDRVDIIAPASASPKDEREKVLPAIRKLLHEWQLEVHIPEDIWGEDFLFANSDAMRLKHLRATLLNTESKAIWCLRGGYGCMRLLPELKKTTPPAQNKIFIGMSDITALHLFLQQQWGWSTLHAGSARQAALGLIEKENIAEIKNIIFGEQKICEYSNLIPLNNAARENKTINSTIVGGNLVLLQTSLGTFWQVDAREKILFIEETSERGYRIDRMLQHLLQAGVFQDVSAVVLGDFIEGKEPDGSSLIEPVLQRFAQENNFPVLQCKGIGHADFNRPLPLGTAAVLQLGENATLRVKV